MIWDLHCHLSGVGGRTPTERMAKLISLADRMGVERLVFFMGFPWSNDPDPAEFRRQNDQVLQALEHWHDRAFGFAYLNPRYPEESVKELDRCVRDGPMVGVKLWVAKKCDAEAIDPIIERATELKAVIYQHTWIKTARYSTSSSTSTSTRNPTGNLPGESTPQNLAVMAKRHPRAKLICGHTGGNWELGIRAIRSAPNVAIGIGGSDPTAGMIEMAVRELGAERIIYGSDIGGRSFASQIAKATGADISDTARKKILKGNLRSRLWSILRDKGVEA